MAPLIVLLLYILFLGDLQVDAVKSFLPEGLNLGEKSVQAFVDSWMLAGVLGVSCITVAFTANSVMVQDKTKFVIYDSISSPVKGWVANLSYFIYNIVVTFVICFIVFCISLIYLAASGSFYMSLGDVFATLGVLIMSVLSASLLFVFVASFLKTEASLSAICGILSAGIGFVIGAFMPINTFPKAIQYFANIIPGSHSAGLFRNFYMNGALENLTKDLPIEMVDVLTESYSLKLNFFGIEIGVKTMFAVLLASIFWFAFINIIAIILRNRKKHIMHL